MKQRELFFYKEYFQVFFDKQTPSTKKKILWTLKLIEELNLIPDHGFQKKTQKTPSGEIEKALKHKQQYYEEKKLNKP